MDIQRPRAFLATPTVAQNIQNVVHIAAQLAIYDKFAIFAPERRRRPFIDLMKPFIHRLAARATRPQHG